MKGDKTTEESTLGGPCCLVIILMIWIFFKVLCWMTGKDRIPGEAAGQGGRKGRELIPKNALCVIPLPCVLNCIIHQDIWIRKLRLTTMF